MEKKKTHITFERESDTQIKVFHNGNHIGNIWSQSSSGTTPYPHDEHEATLESIQICGFIQASKIWSCSVFHGTKDIVLRFNPCNDEFYNEYYGEYKEYVNECFRQNKPQLIKPFNCWVAHMSHPTVDDTRREEVK
jgi:hypothetical protein